MTVKFVSFTSWRYCKRTASQQQAFTKRHHPYRYSPKTLMSTNIPQRRLGRDGPLVPTIGLGLMGMHAFYGPAQPDEQCFKVMDRAIDLGNTFWDTSDFYNDNEGMIGRYFKSRPGAREKVFLATKFGGYVEDGVICARTDREYVFMSIDRSLEKLGVDYVDLYYAHRIDKNTPIEETALALKEIVQAGKAKYVGLSEASARTIDRFCKVHPLHAVQMEYSPFSLDVEDLGVVDACKRNGITLVAYSPLANGFFGKRFKTVDDFPEGDFRSYHPRFSPENYPKNLALVDVLEAVAKRKGVTTAQLCLAWEASKGILPIPGTTRVEALEENTAARDIILSASEVAEIDAYAQAAKPKVIGGRNAYTNLLVVDTVGL